MIVFVFKICVYNIKKEGENPKNFSMLILYYIFPKKARFFGYFNQLIVLVYKPGNNTLLLISFLCQYNRNFYILMLIPYYHPYALSLKKLILLFSIFFLSLLILLKSFLALLYAFSSAMQYSISLLRYANFV